MSDQNALPTYDEIEEAARRRRMSRAQFFGFYAFGLEGAQADEQARHYARRVLNTQSGIVSLLERGICDPPKEPVIRHRR